MVDDSEADARITVEALLARMDAPNSIRSRSRSLRELFDKADVIDPTTSVFSDPDGSGAAAVLVLRVPLAESDSERGRFEPSGLPYRELVDLLLERDVLWLATHSPEGLVGC